MKTTGIGIAAALIAAFLLIGLAGVGADEGLTQAEGQAVVDEALKLGRADRICLHLTEHGVSPSQVIRRTFYQGGSQSGTVRTVSTGGQGGQHQWWTDNNPVYIDHVGHQGRTGRWWVRPYQGWIYYVGGDRSKPTVVPDYQVDQRYGSGTTSRTVQVQEQSPTSESKWIYVADAEVQYPGALMSSIWGSTSACAG